MDTLEVKYYDKEGFSDTLLTLVKNILSSTDYIDYYDAAANTDGTFYEENITKLGAFNLNVDKLQRIATDPVATEWEGRSDKPHYLTNRQGCSCIGALYVLWVWIYDRSNNLTPAQAVEKGIAMIDPSIAPGTVCQITDNYWDEVTRADGGWQRDSIGNIADIVAKLEQAEFPCVVGKSIRRGQNFVWSDGNFEGGVVGIVLSNSSSEEFSDNATKTYGIMFKPGYNKIVVTSFSRGHCRNMVKVDEGRAKAAINCIRAAYDAGKGVSNVFFLLAAVILLTLPYFAQVKGWERISKGDLLSKFTNVWRMAYLLKLHGFILRCRCGDPGREFHYLDRANNPQSIHNLVNTGSHVHDPRFDCNDVADTHAANFITFEPNAVEMARVIVNSTATSAEGYGIDEFKAACDLIDPCRKQWIDLKAKAARILRLEDRANRIADVLSVKVTEE